MVNENTRFQTRLVTALLENRKEMFMQIIEGVRCMN